MADGRFILDIENGIYTITSPNGVSRTFKLPAASDNRSIKKLTYEAEDFVKQQGGTIGQINAARKKLTEFGYHITPKNPFQSMSDKEKKALIDELNAL
jgi:hypothetical protein